MAAAMIASPLFATRHGSPLTPLSSGAEVLSPGIEADGVADAMIEAGFTQTKEFAQ